MASTGRFPAAAADTLRADASPRLAASTSGTECRLMYARSARAMRAAVRSSAGFPATAGWNTHRAVPGRATPALDALPASR
jgi:hypothetical protein